MKDVSPPVINRPAEDAEMQQLAYEASAAIEAADKATKNTLERYKEAGEALSKAKKKCGHGKWLSWLKGHGIHVKTAGRALRVAANWSKLDTVSNLADAFKAMAEAPEETEKAKPVDKAPLCKRCQNVGPTKDCKACEEAAAEWRAKKKPKPDETSEREPGDDTDHEEQAKEDEKSDPKPGKPKFDWKLTNTNVGILVREVDKFGKAYKVKEEPEVDELRKRLADWHTDFKSVYEKITKEKAPEATS